MIILSFIFSFADDKATGVIKAVGKVLGPIIPVVIAGAAAYNDDQSSKKAEAQINELKDQVSELSDSNKSLQAELNRVTSDMQEIKDGIKGIASSIENNTKKLLGYDFNIFESSSNFANMLEKYSLLDKVLIFNILSSATLLYYLLSFIMGKYGNFIIDRYDLQSKYPRLERFFRYRATYQRYYFIYSSTMGVILLLFNLYINLYIIFTH